MHPDLTSSAQDRDQEIGRLLALGARWAGIGPTGAGSWTVLADPKETSPARYAQRKRSPGKAQHRPAQIDPVRGIMPVIKDQITALRRHNT